ncbi:MAG: hypothetical protein Q9M76_03175 [Candidatus Dojkabacteria bacterium]|nr:hypothetical protein [Candidatus Dojkabacteria bacterium]
MNYSEVIQVVEWDKGNFDSRTIEEVSKREYEKYNSLKYYNMTI